MIAARILGTAALSLVCARAAYAIDVLPPDAADGSRVALESTLDANTHHGGSIDASATFAPFGTIYDSGPRLRLVGGKSWYRYLANEDPRETASGHGGEVGFLIGYGLSAPRVSVIGLIGPAFSYSRDAGVRRSFEGAKIVFSAYATPTDRTMTYISFTHSTIATTSLFQAKIGAKMPLGFYIGPEMNATWRQGNPLDTPVATKRLGLHLSSIKLGPWYLSVSAGWMHEDELGSGKYVGVSVYGGF